VFENTGVLCENRNGQSTCCQASFSNSLVDCNAGACVNANFTDTTVQCFATVGDGSCDGASAYRSMVNCTQRYAVFTSLAEVVCSQIDFYASSAQCNYGACTNPWFFRCSCCDGLGCPEGVPSCTALPVDFCSTLYIGRTCKDWGNPVCNDVSVQRDSKNSSITYCTEGACRQAQFSGAAVLCDNKDYFGTGVTCHGIVASNSAVSCEAGACLNAKFMDSTVTCQKTRGDPSCIASTISRSTVA
jgi:hypothetical protein